MQKKSARCKLLLKLIGKTQKNISMPIFQNKKVGKINGPFVSILEPF
jgi:hypothetical protein